MSTANIRRRLKAGQVLLLISVLTVTYEEPARGLPAPQTGSAASALEPQLSTSDVLAGRVVNAITAAPIARALVQINGRAVLTDQAGRFRFEQPGQPASSLTARKPGFSSTPEQGDGSAIEVDDQEDAGSLTLRLWPEALLAGTVTGQDGEPVPQVNVVARRSLFDEQGHHLQIAGQCQTDSHGQFRIPVAAGDYTVESAFSKRGFGRDEAVLPARFPGNTSSSLASTVHVNSGEEKHLDLRPGIRRTHAVTLPLDSGDEGPPPHITARSSDGLSFSVNPVRSQEPGTLRINLPSGTYDLRATRFSRDGTQFGDSSITVGDGDVSGSPLHLAATPVIPIELATDSSGGEGGLASPGSHATTTPPGVMQFNLVLETVAFDSPSSFQSGIRPTQQNDRVGIAAPPGIYRLNAGLASGWYIRNATSGGTDLLRENLVVSPGSSPPPIALVVSNQTGSLRGTVRLSGKPAACWIYLIATSAALPRVMIHQSDASGVVKFGDLPPGSYRVIAFPYWHSADLENPAVLDRFAFHVGSATIVAGTTASLDLDAVTAKELMP